MKFETLEKRINLLYNNEFTLISINGNKCTVRHNCEKCNNFIIENISVKGDIYKGIYTCKECRRLAEKEKFIDKLKLNGFSFVEDIDYVNCDTKVKIRHNCSICNNYEWDIKPRNFDGECKECNRLDRTKTIEDFKKDVYNVVGDEYSVIGNKYINNKTPIEIRHNCPDCNYYSWKIEPRNFLNSKNNNRIRCEVCRKNENKLNIEDFKAKVYDLVGDEYTVISENYINNETHVQMRHNSDKCNYHIWSVRPNLFTGIQSTRCPKCCNSRHESNSEIELRTYVSTITSDVIFSDRETLEGQEIDILVKILKTGFEYNGLYWHSEINKPKNYHINKTLNSLNKGINLIHIFEDEWIEHPEIVKSKILHILKLNNKPKIYARQCEIKELTNNNEIKLKNEFLNKNHIQGEDKSKIKLGLFYNNKLISVMTFVKPRISLGQKTNSIYDYELSRFASDIDYNVVGAFSKLFKYFERNYEWNKIITYADRRWSQGNVYIKNGWTHLRNSKPNYWYCKGQKRYHRYNFRKSKLKTLFPDLYDEKLSEFQIMDKTNYFRVWDCGNMVFEYSKK